MAHFQRWARKEQALPASHAMVNHRCWHGPVGRSEGQDEATAADDGQGGADLASRCWFESEPQTTSDVENCGKQEPQPSLPKLPLCCKETLGVQRHGNDAYAPVSVFFVSHRQRPTKWTSWKLIGCWNPSPPTDSLKKSSSPPASGQMMSSLVVCLWLT